MQTNIFIPYNVLQFIPSEKIELVLSKKRRIVNFILFRIYPFILLALLGVCLFFAQDISLLLLSLFVLAIVVICSMLFFKKYPIHILINKKEIKITEKRFNKTVVYCFSFNEIKKITCYETYGRGGGTYFSIITNSNQKISLLNIPVLQMNNAKTKNIVEQIEKITGIQVAMT